jgi:hypothetical protein
MNRMRSFVLTIGIFLLLTSCNLPGVAEPTPTATPAPTATPVPSPTFTATPIPPMLSVSADVPCYAGPSDLYELIVNLAAGVQVEIVGQADSYWIVKPPAAANCWVADQQVTIVGEVASLPKIDPPPTPIPTKPIAPDNVGLIYQKCSVDRTVRPIMAVNEFRVSWRDLSNNEDGFWVYRDGDRIAEIEANRTDVTDVMVLRNNRVHYYYVVAYNEVGESKSEVKAVSCGK